MCIEADISIVGPGRVGTTLSILACRSGLRVAVGARRPQAARAAARAAGADAHACTPAQAAAASNLVLLTVPDGAIECVCGDLANHFRPGAVVAHCSGALDSGVLGPASARGCQVGSIHPLQTFPTVAAAVESFPGTYCFIEGSPAAVEALGGLAERLGGRAQTIAAGRKALYHAAAAMACNHLSALLDAAASLAKAAGVGRETALSALGPIVRATVENVLSMGPASALTGPVARADSECVRRHLASMADCPPDLVGFYRAAARWTVDLALRKGTVTAEQADALRSLLQGSGDW